MITIYGNVPSKKNSRQIICRGPRPISLPSQSYKEWHQDACMQLLQYIGIKLGKELHLTFYPRTKHKGDLTNKAESVMDLLVDMKLLEDDNWYEVTELHLSFGGVDKINPRVEII